jgi:hypothetical protein
LTTLRLYRPQKPSKAQQRRAKQAKEEARPVRLAQQQRCRYTTKAMP